MINEQDILRFLEGNASANEVKNLQLWKEANQENLDFFNDIKLIWSASSSIKDYHAVDTDKEWSKFNNLITEEEQITQTNNSKKDPIKTRRITLLPYSIAASLAILIGVFFYSQYQLPQEVITNLTQVITTEEGTKEVALPDNTMIKLDTKSSIEYATTFDADTVRQVSLLTGSAVFDVAHDPNKKFVVYYEGVAIEVLGTKFELGKKNDQVSINLKSGSIKAYEINNKNNSIIMSPGDEFLFTGEIFTRDKKIVNRPVKKVTPKVPEPSKTETPKIIKEEIVVTEKPKGSVFRIGDVLDFLDNKYGKQLKIGRKLKVDKKEKIRIDIHQSNLRLILDDLEKATNLSTKPGKCADCYIITAGSKK